MTDTTNRIDEKDIARSVSVVLYKDGTPKILMSDGTNFLEGFALLQVGAEICKREAVNGDSAATRLNKMKKEVESIREELDRAQSALQAKSS